MTLAYFAAEYGTDKLEHGFCPAYEHHLGYLKDEPINLLEIGIISKAGSHECASLRTWADYFTAAHIVGVDVVPATLEHERVEVVNANIHDYEPLVTPDVIIDDGSHVAGDIVATFHRLWATLESGAWYVIEDWATQWDQPGYGSGPDGSPAVDLVHDLMRNVLAERPDRTIDELHCYPQIVLIKKR